MGADLIEMGRRAVACKGWRWMPGMIDTDGNRLERIWPEDGDWSAINTDESGGLGARYHTLSLSPDDLACPDLSDPATVGCLLALVREAWGDPMIHVRLTGDHTVPYVVAYGRAPVGLPAHGWSEAEALVCALEAAP